MAFMYTKVGSIPKQRNTSTWFPISPLISCIYSLLRTPPALRWHRLWFPGCMSTHSSEPSPPHPTALASPVGPKLHSRMFQLLSCHPALLLLSTSWPTSPPNFVFVYQWSLWIMFLTVLFSLPPNLKEKLEILLVKIQWEDRYQQPPGGIGTESLWTEPSLPILASSVLSLLLFSWGCTNGSISCPLLSALICAQRSRLMPPSLFPIFFRCLPTFPFLYSVPGIGIVLYHHK